MLSSAGTYYCLFPKNLNSTTTINQLIMVSLIYDKDVQTFLLTLALVIIISIVNQYKLKYKENWRFWLGIIFVSMGLAGIIVRISLIDIYTFFGGFFWIIIGLALWLIKAKKLK